MSQMLQMLYFYLDLVAFLEEMSHFLYALGPLLEILNGCLNNFHWFCWGVGLWSSSRYHSRSGTLKLTIYP